MTVSSAITGAVSTRDRREKTLAMNHDGTDNVLTTTGKFDMELLILAPS
jgi:hypothetical protein